MNKVIPVIVGLECNKKRAYWFGIPRVFEISDFFLWKPTRNDLTSKRQKSEDKRNVISCGINDRINYLAANHVFNCIDEQAPEYLQVFERVNESHHCNTRNSVINALILPKVCSYGIRSFHYIGAKTWNSLPDEIQTTFSKSLFKVRCKKHFMSVLSES